MSSVGRTRKQDASTRPANQRSQGQGLQASRPMSAVFNSLFYAFFSSHYPSQRFFFKPGLYYPRIICTGGRSWIVIWEASSAIAPAWTCALAASFPSKRSFELMPFIQWHRDINLPKRAGNMWLEKEAAK